MNKMKHVIIVIGTAIFLFVNTNISAYAYDVNTGSVNYSIEIEDDEMLSDATLILTDSYIENGRQITVNVYELPDGTTVTDTLSVSAMATYSKTVQIQRLEQEKFLVGVL